MSDKIKCYVRWRNHASDAETNATQEIYMDLTDPNDEYLTRREVAKHMYSDWRGAIIEIENVTPQ